MKEVHNFTMLKAAVTWQITSSSASNPM